MSAGAEAFRLVACVLLVSGCAAQPRALSKTAPLSLPPLQDGDVLLSGSSGWRSWVVRTFDDKQTPYTHAALVLIENGKPVLVHASPTSSTGMAALPLADYLASPILLDLAIYRAENAVLATTAAAEARRYLAIATPFDADYNIADDSRLYCTEMIWRSYYNAGVDLLGTPRRPLRAAPVFGPLIWPSDFVEMPALKPVFTAVVR